MLTLGDPDYPGADAPGPTASTAVPDARSRFRSAGGRLPRLPFTGWETSWVAKAFADQGAMAVTLTGPSATEARVRAGATGRRLIHLACHGLTDPAHGNFFGALALTPGPGSAADSANDGFLTLPEVYDLDLKGCELAVLSACETNFFGLRHRGEGTWAISNGFLVAGALSGVGQQLAGRRRGGGEPGQRLLHRAGAGREGKRAGRIRRLAPGGEAVGQGARQVEKPLLLGLARARRAALTPKAAGPVRNR